jgi:hypothetical protein
MLQSLQSFAISFFSWLKSVYSEPDGSGSSTRIHISLLTGFVIGIGISFAISVHHKLVTISEFNAFLGAASAFLIATAGPLYGLNKAADWLKNRDNNQQPPNAPSS